MNVGVIIHLVHEAKHLYVNIRNTDPNAREQLLHLHNELMAQIGDIGALLQELFYSVLYDICFQGFSNGS